MENNLFFKLGRFLKNYPIISIIIFASAFYLIISDSDEIKSRKKSCEKYFGLKKDTIEYKNCYKDGNSNLAYGFINQLVRNKETLINHNHAILSINNIKVGVNHSQYRVVDLENYLKNNFVARKTEVSVPKKNTKDPIKYQSYFDYNDLKPLSDKVYDEKITFLVDDFEVNTKKIEDSFDKAYSVRLSKDKFLFKSRFSNFKIEHKIFSSSHYTGAYYDLDNLWLEYQGIESKPLARVYGTFQNDNDRIFKNGAFYIDDVIFFKNNIDDKMLYEKSLKKYINDKHIKNDDIDKFLRLINQDELFKRLLEVKPNK